MVSILLLVIYRYKLGRCVWINNLIKNLATGTIKQANWTKRHHANGVHAKMDDESLGGFENIVEEAIGVYRIRDVEEGSRV